MQKRKLWGLGHVVLLAALFVIVGAGSVLAQTANSDNYKASEMQFGGGSTLESCSGSYCARTSIGDLAGGESKSASNTAVFGPLAPGEPSVDVIVEQLSSNLGVLSTETTGTKTMKIKIRTYLTDGYQLQIAGDPPKYSNHTLATSSTNEPSTPGTEQFGINLADNSTPDIGAGPVQVPSGDFSFGSVVNGYGIANQFKYINGQTVARSTTQSGETEYTLSLIVNISNQTPAGHFSGDYSAVVIPVF